ncbi:MAG TPA: hypothetical protein VL326_37900 [Kofleriaceae bacterium]|nr:hypothetical protein [Kofleriaceae bacterium]
MQPWRSSSTIAWHAPRNGGGAMFRHAVFVLACSLALTRVAIADDTDVPFDPTVDECAAPDSGCITDAPEPTDASLDVEEAAASEDVMPVAWQAATDQLACPDGATPQDGHCIATDATPADASGGCTTGKLPGIVLVLVLVLVLARRRPLLLLLAACALGGGSWDDAVDAGPTGDTTTYADVLAAELADTDGAQYLLANQALAAGADEPVAQFSLLRVRTEVPVFRTHTACGDRLATQGEELLGWARASAGDGTAELVELAAPDGCAFTYETDTDAIATRVAQGFHVTGTIAYVWPPGMSDAPAIEPPEADETALAAPAPCHVDKHSALQLLYASPGKDYTLRFLRGCPGEVVVGEKRELGPVGAMKSADAQAAGGRTAFVLDRHGDKLRELLLRDNGVERTAAYLRHKISEGYDYIVIDEITAASDYRDGTTLNRRLRKLLLRMPARTIIPYISIDLTQHAYGYDYMRGRRLLLRAFKRRARVLALEVYLHTGEVRAGYAPATMRRAADRLALAVHGLSGTGGINRRAITVLGTSMHSSYAQYRYLDQPSYDLAALSREVNAIRHGSKRLRQQQGIGWYFVNKSDMDPPSAYSYDALIRRMRLLGLRFK